MAETEVRIWFDGEELTLTKSAVKRSANPALTGGDWWNSVGVPVFGMLEPGTYLVESEVILPDFPDFEDSANVTVLAEDDC